MRLFIAVDVPQSKVFENFYQRFVSMGRGIKPVLPENLHLTLKFLGDPGCSEREIIGLLDKIRFELEPFEMKVGEAGCFPSWSRPSILWISFENDMGLVKIADKIDEVLHSHLGISRETRKFRTHLTVARIRGSIETSLLKTQINKMAATLKEMDYSVPVDCFHLYSSTLTPKGPIYNKLSTHPIGRSKT